MPQPRIIHHQPQINSFSNNSIAPINPMTPQNTQPTPQKIQNPQIFQSQPKVTISPQKFIHEPQQMLEKSKASEHIPQPMIFSFNNNNSLQSNLIETTQSQQINIPRYSVVESQQANSPLINESPIRHEYYQHIEMNHPHRFDSPGKVQIQEPIIYQNQQIKQSE